MTKSEFDDIKKRLFRLETLMWILVAKMGIEGAEKLAPVLSALISGGGS